MTDEELAAIRKRLDTPMLLHSTVDGKTLNQLSAIAGDTARLLAEVERLRVENAALREIAQALADSNGFITWHDATDVDEVCKFCENGWGLHEPDCPVTKARALLGEKQ